MLTRFLCLLAFMAWMWHRQGLASAKTSSTPDFKSTLGDLLDNGSYDRTIRPFSDVGQALRVEVDVVLNTLGPVIEREMQMTASFYLRQQWRDPRLASSTSNQTVLLNHRRVDSIWLPDMYFSQSKNEYSHIVTVPNLLIRVRPDGTILFSQRITVTFQCLMDLRKFPLDVQTCYIRMESYSHTTDDMYFAWSSERKNMDILENAHIPDFELTEISTHDCTATYATGTFPCLEARLFLHRQIGFYMTQTYIPCVLIVSLSWVSFWLDAQAVPARVSVGLVTVLTITTQSSGVRSQLPRVPYTKSIDVWMSVCLIFVFAAYMQYAFVTVFSRRHRKSCFKSPDANTAKKPDSGSKSVVTSEVSVNDVTLKEGTKSLKNGVWGFWGSSKQSSSASTLRRSEMQCGENSRDKSQLIDKWSRILFPLSFVLFNVAYWMYYTLSVEIKKAN